MSSSAVKKNRQKEEQNDGQDSPPPTNLPTPPDGGWGWFVVLGSFMIHVIADGVTYSFGIFVEEFMEFFKVGAGSVSFIPSILVGITLGSGPIASVITNRYGCRVATVAGAILATFGLAISAAVNNIPGLYLTIGLCTGLGFGLIYLPAIVSVSMYFEKKRAFATGIAVCGSGLGTFILSPVTSILIQNFGWHGAILRTSGVVSLCVLFGLLFRPLKGPPEDDDKEANVSLKEEAEEMNKGDNGVFKGNVPPEIYLNGEVFRPLGADDTRMALSHPVISSFSASNASGKNAKISSCGSYSKIYEKNLTVNGNVDNQRRASHHSMGVMNRKDILYGGSLYNIPEFRMNPDRYSKKATLDTLELDPIETEQNLCQTWSAAFKKMVDLSLLRNSVYIIFAISNFLTSVGFNVPYVYTFDRAQNTLGMSKEDASYLISIIGIANTVGRIVLGYISDKPCLNTLYLYNGCLALCGIAIGLSNFCTDYTTQAIYCAVFGITSGAYVGLTSVVLVELIGLDQLTHGFGLLLLFQGIASVIGPPVIGALKDSLGTYDVGFYLAGFVIFLSGVMLFILPWVIRRQKNGSKSIENGS